MTEQPLVSVIINCYNSAKYLRETIDSLIAQTYSNWEAIFWDNCSTDKTAEIIKSYGDPRFRYFLAEKNTPLGYARNLAVDNAKGEIVTFLDSDDLWKETWVESFVNMFKSDDSITIVFCRFEVFSSNYSRLNRTLLKNEEGYLPMDEFINKYSVGMSGAAINKRILDFNQIRFDESFNLIEDYDFFVRIASYGKIYFFSTPYFMYREHSDNLSHKASTWHTEFEAMKAHIVTSEPSYELLSNYMSSIDKKIETYTFIDALNEKNYLRAFLKHPRTFYRWLCERRKL